MFCASCTSIDCVLFVRHHGQWSVFHDVGSVVESAQTNQRGTDFRPEAVGDDPRRRYGGYIELGGRYAG